MVSTEQEPPQTDYDVLKNKLRQDLQDHVLVSRERKRLALETLVDELETTDAQRDEMVERAARYLAHAAHNLRRVNTDREMEQAGEAYLKVSVWLQQNKEQIHLP